MELRLRGFLTDFRLFLRLADQNVPDHADHLTFSADEPTTSWPVLMPAELIEVANHGVGLSVGASKKHLLYNRSPTGYIHDYLSLLTSTLAVFLVVIRIALLAFIYTVSQ